MLALLSPSLPLGAFAQEHGASCRQFRHSLELPTFQGVVKEEAMKATVGLEVTFGKLTRP